MKTPTFKKGQWLISRWKKEEGGGTDLCKFEKGLDDNNFYYSVFYRFETLVFKKLFGEIENKLDYISYNDIRKSLQWRPATKAELKKYSQLIFS